MLHLNMAALPKMEIGPFLDTIKKQIPGEPCLKCPRGVCKIFKSSSPPAPSIRSPSIMKIQSTPTPTLSKPVPPWDAGKPTSTSAG